MSSFSLAGKNVIVTGATRGIGLAMARGFLETGASVTICSRKAGNVEAAVESLRSVSKDVLGVVCHVGDCGQLDGLIGQSQDRFGDIDVLVNNAGTNPYFGPVIDADELAWDKTLQVNLKGPFLLSQRVARKMVASGGGSIINIASINGLAAAEKQGIYCVSKAGLIMLTKVMAKEWGEHKIRVNCICPGLVKTKLSESLWSDPNLEKEITAHKALGRSAVPDEIVGAAVYFASDASSFTTGSVLQVDGGMVL